MSCFTEIKLKSFVKKLVNIYTLTCDLVQMVSYNELILKFERIDFNRSVFSENWNKNEKRLLGFIFCIN